MDKITNEDVRKLTLQMQASFKDIENAWKFIMDNDIPILKKSWVGKDCDAFTKKLLDLNDSFKKTEKIQKDLLNTFEVENKKLSSNSATTSTSDN